MANNQTFQNGFQLDDQSGIYTDPKTGGRYNQEQYQQFLQQQQADDAKAKNHASMLAQGMNDDGSPIRKAFDSLVDPTTGKMPGQYTMNLSGLDPTQWEGFSKYKQEALRTGPSAWAQLQQQQNNSAMLNNKETAARQAASGMNQNLSNLALHGGTSSGARALAGVQSNRDMLMARQQAQRAGDTANMQTSTTDEGNRVAQLANLSQNEQQIGQYNKTLEGKQQEFNIGNLLHENDAKRSYNDMTYSEQMKKWAADKQAEATAHSGGGGGKK